MPDRFARGRLLFAALAVVDGNRIDRDVQDPALHDFFTRNECFFADTHLIHHPFKKRLP
jgi:hypothetical protein